MFQLILSVNPNVTDELIRLSFACVVSLQNCKGERDSFSSFPAGWATSCCNCPLWKGESCFFLCSQHSLKMLSRVTKVVSENSYKTPSEWHAVICVLGQLNIVMLVKLNLVLSESHARTLQTGCTTLKSYVNKAQFFPSLQGY